MDNDERFFNHQQIYNPLGPHTPLPHTNQLCFLGLCSRALLSRSTLSCYRGLCFQSPWAVQSCLRNLRQFLLSQSKQKKCGAPPLLTFKKIGILPLHLSIPYLYFIFPLNYLYIIFIHQIIILYLTLFHLSLYNQETKTQHLSNLAYGNLNPPKFYQETEYNENKI